MGNGPVDFAVTGNAGDDEELPSSDKPKTSLRRLRADIAVAVVILGGAALLARVLSSGKHTTAGTPTPTPSVASNQAPSLTGPPPRGVFTFAPANGMQAIVTATPCPHLAADRCVRTHAVPRSVVAAVHRAFPQLAIDNVETTFERATDARIWSRTIAGHDRDTYLIAVVSRQGPTGHRAGRTEIDGQTQVYALDQQSPYAVQVAIIGLSRPAPSVSKVVELANDPRLVRRG